MTPERIGNFLESISKFVRGVSPEISLIADIGANIIPSVGKQLEEYRQRWANEAKSKLEEVLKGQFGVWISEPASLTNAPMPESASSPFPPESDPSGGNNAWASPS